MSKRSHSATLQASLLAALLAFAAPALAADVTVTLGAGSGFVVEDNTGTIERLRVDEATGNISRNGALFVHTTGAFNTFVGQYAGSTATTGSRNSAFGQYALFSNSTGTHNSAFGMGAQLFNSTGFDNSAFGYAALRDNSSGFTNSAFGSNALSTNTTGFGNSAFGGRALIYNQEGDANSAFGGSALHDNNTGYENSAFGSGALRYNTTGDRNSAFGRRALFNNLTGRFNTAIGEHALYNATGDNNVALGRMAGWRNPAGNDNIFIANTGADFGESGSILIGTQGQHTRTWIAGIWPGSENDRAVYVNSSGGLGTPTSSLRFKQDVRDMGETSKMLMQLRPVTFRYREAVANGEAVDVHGLIAEEVAEVAPGLVSYDDDGRPHSVRYHVLPSLLLNEMQKQQGTIEGQAGVIDEQRAVIAALAERVERLESRYAVESVGSDR